MGEIRCPFCGGTDFELTRGCASDDWVFTHECDEFGIRQISIVAKTKSMVHRLWKERFDGLSETKPTIHYAPFLQLCTCWGCKEKDTCRSAWDPYNTNGDCLEAK